MSSMSSCFSFSLKAPFDSDSPCGPLLDAEARGGLVELERIVGVGMSRGREEVSGDGGECCA